MSSLKEKEILVVDDSPEVRKLARKMLENDGAVVREATSVEEGLKFVSSNRPHLVLLDLQFPTETGFTFLLHRKASTAWQEIPTIVLSGSNDKTSVVRAISLGATDYLLKPFRTSLLLQKVRKALRLSTFQTKQFPPGNRPKLHITIQAEIEKINEAGFTLGATAKFGADEVIQIESDGLKEFGGDMVITKSSSRPASYNGNGRYTNKILFSGVGEEFTKNVRRSLKKAS